MSKQAIIGVDLGGTKVSVGKVRGQHLERHHAQRVAADEPEDRVLEQIFAAVDRVFDDDVAGIGCCVPSLVDVDRGIVYHVENIPSWRQVHLKDHLETRYGTPAYINNDANAFALGELHFGEGRGYRHLVGVTLGTGLGAGIIIDGRLYSGANCGAGELGAIPHKDHTVEFYCAGSFFQDAAGEPGEVIYARAQQGDTEAIDLFHAYGNELAHAVMTVLYAYDPEIVVLGGSVSKAFALFESGLRERLQAYDYQHALERTVITCSQTANVALLGAAALYLDACSLGTEPDS